MTLEIGIYHPGSEAENPSAYNSKIKYLALRTGDPRIESPNVLLTRYYTQLSTNYPKYGSISFPWATADTPLTNIDWVEWRFWLAANRAADLPYEYYGFMNQEELFHPSIQASWWNNPAITSDSRADKSLKTWKTTWTSRQLANTGITVICIRDWYNAKGYSSVESFDIFWTRVSATNNYADSKVWEWSISYGKKLHEAWHIHVHQLGKKSAIVGVTGIPTLTRDQLNAGRSGTDSIKTWYYPGALGDYVLQNYDLFFIYQYPETIDNVVGGKRPVLQSLNAVKTFRLMTNKLIAFIPTVVWWNNIGSADPIVQKAEILACAPYVDIIWSPRMQI